MTDSPPFSLPGFVWDPVYVWLVALGSWLLRKRRFFKQSQKPPTRAQASNSRAGSTKHLQRSSSQSRTHRTIVQPGLSSGNVRYTSAIQYRKYV